MIPISERNQYGLLLSGGGARAAYQVGVLKAITTFIPRNHSIPFPIICGTSAGAINAASLATHASCFHLGVRKLEWVWRNFRTHQVYAASFGGTVGHLIKNLASRLQTDELQPTSSSLLNNKPLRQLLTQTLSLQRINRNIHSGKLKALAITASSYSQGDAVTFYQGVSDIQPWQRAHRRGIASQIDIEHLMASSAIPVMFPVVNIDKEYFGDGAIHQFAPLSSPIHLGAEKIFIIGLEQPKSVTTDITPISPPSVASIAGHILDAVFADSLKSDLERVERINQTLSILSPKQQAQTPLKRIECLSINPSESFDDIAYQHYHRLPISVKHLLKLIGVKGNGGSSLLSYLLFESEFCQALIEMGYQDGLDQQHTLKHFLNL